MPKQRELSHIKHMEFWTCLQASLVLGRSKAYWANCFDTGLVSGYREKSKSGLRDSRRIDAESARAYLKSLCGQTKVVTLDVRSRIEERKREWRESRKATAV